MRKSQRHHNRKSQQLPPPILYKYVHPDRLEVLKHQAIRFTQPQFLNDPFEVRPIFRGIIEGQDFDEVIEDETEKMISDWFSANPFAKTDESGKEIVRIFMKDAIDSLRHDLAKLTEGVAPILDEGFCKAAQNKVAILSLTEERNNLLMWSHYAHQHRGFVIGFKSSHDFINHKKSDEDQMRHPRKMKYSSLRPKISKKYLNDPESDIFK